MHENASHKNRSFFVTLLCLIVFTAAFTGCADINTGSHITPVQTNGFSDIISAVSETEIISQITQESTGTEPSVIMTKAYNGADIDLTVMSPNMVYAQVFSMVMEPSEYIGLTVRMEGQFIFFHDDEADKNYYACIIRDATQCCAQGIEFEPSDEVDELPEDGDTVRVIGVFDMYEENGNKYLTLRDSVLEPVTQD